MTKTVVLIQRAFFGRGVAGTPRAATRAAQPVRSARPAPQTPLQRLTAVEGKARVAMLNRRRVERGLKPLDDCGDSFWSGQSYVLYTDQKGIEAAEKEVGAT